MTENSGNNKKVAIVYNDVFEQLDVFGKFQTLQYALVCIPLLFVSMMNVNYVFVAGDLDYRCVVPECESNATLERPLWWPPEVDYKCQTPVLDPRQLHNNSCTSKSFLGLVDVCRQWVYESNNSIVGELNLACQSWKSTLVGSIHNAGMIASMCFMGWISDKYGRKPAVVICSIGGFVGIFKCVADSYTSFILLEFLESALCSGLYTVAMVLMIEAGGQSKRVLAGVIFSCTVYVGEALFAFIAMFVPYWKHLIVIIYSPAIIFIIYIWVLRESTRWQMLRGKLEEAKVTLTIIAKMNGIAIGTNDIMNLEDNELRKKFHVEDKSEQVVIKDILMSKETMRRLGVASFCFFSAGFVYYGLTVHSVLLPGNKYTNFILSALTSLPGDFLAFFTFNKFGRRISLMSGFFACGVFCLMTGYAPGSMPWLKIFLFLCGKLAVALCATGMYTYSLELFPTSIRGSLVAFCNTGARIGSMLAPMTPLLSPTMEALPSILFAGASVLAAILLIFTPETKNLPLVDTIEQMEKTKDNVVMPNVTSI